jgi:hypothetical protein
MHLLAHISILVVSLLFCASSAMAEQVSYRKSWKVRKRADAIVEVLTDYNRYCDSGCRYRYPSVTTAVILPYKRTDTSFFVWTLVEDIKDSEWFSHVTIRKNGNRSVVQFSMVSEKQGERLEKISRRPHDPVFDTCITRYEITEVFRDNRFLFSQITFSAKVTVSGLISIFSGAIKSGLEETGKAMIDNINRGTSKRPKEKRL